MMGQIAGMIKETKPLSEIFENMVQDAQKHNIQLQSKLGVNNG